MTLLDYARKNNMTLLDYVRKNNIELCVKDKDGRIVAWCVGYSDNELKSLLKRHPGWYVSGAKFE